MDQSFHYLEIDILCVFGIRKQSNLSHRYKMPGDDLNKGSIPLLSLAT